MTNGDNAGKATYIPYGYVYLTQDIIQHSLPGCGYGYNILGSFLLTVWNRNGEKANKSI